MFVKYNDGSNKPAIIEVQQIRPVGGSSDKVVLKIKGAAWPILHIGNVYSITDTMPDLD